jgi:hypothetical protein
MEPVHKPSVIGRLLHARKALCPVSLQASLHPYHRIADGAAQTIEWHSGCLVIEPFEFVDQPQS